MSDNTNSQCVVKPLNRNDLDEADRIIRVAFGTFLHLPDPMTMFGDKDMIRKRFGDTSSILGAYIDQKLVGLNVVTRWGRFGWFGPLAVLPEFWDKGVAKRIMTSTMDLFSEWKTSGEGLFTFPESPKHIGLYQKFGFYPRFLTPVMTRKATSTKQRYSTFSRLTNNKQCEEILRECREISDTVYPGLDLTHEIQSVWNKKLGDTVLLTDESRVEGFAICHVGAGTEAGSETCYIKFGAVPSSKSPEKFSKLVDACTDFAGSSGAQKVEAGVNLGRTRAYEELRRLGFRTIFQGIAMQRPNEPGSNRPEVFAIDDWR